MNYSLNITVPPATDIDGLIGVYGSLMRSMDIECPMLQGDPQNFSHPIEASREILLSELEQNHQVLKGLKDQYRHVAVINAMMANNNARLQVLLKCSGDTEEYINVSLPQ